MCAYVCICVCTCVLCKHTHARMLLFKAFYLQECIIYKLRYLSSNLDAFIYYFAFTYLFIILLLLALPALSVIEVVKTDIPTLYLT